METLKKMLIMCLTLYYFGYKNYNSVIGHPLYKVGPSSPIKYVPNDTQVDVGDPLELPCVVSNSRGMLVRWYKGRGVGANPDAWLDYQPELKNERLSIEWNANSSMHTYTLRINSTRLDDSGIYRCVAYNYVGYGSIMYDTKFRVEEVNVSVRNVTRDGAEDAQRIIGLSVTFTLLPLAIILICICICYRAM